MLKFGLGALAGLAAAMFYQTVGTNDVRKLMRASANTSLEFAGQTYVLVDHATIGGMSASGPTVVFFGYPDNQSACLEVAKLYEDPNANRSFSCEPASDLKNWKS